MKMNMRLGGILASIAAVIGILGHFILFMNWYRVGMAAESAEPGCEILLKYIHPGLADLGILAGVIFAVSAYGFFTKCKVGFLTIDHRYYPGIVEQLVHKCPLHGSRFTPGLLQPLLALPDFVFPFLEGRGESLLEHHLAGIVHRVGLHYLLHEWCFQHQPHHHHRVSTLRPRPAPALGCHDRLGGGNRGAHSQTERMDARCWAGLRWPGARRGHPAGICHCSKFGTFLPVCPRTHHKPDPGRIVPVAKYVGAADRFCKGTTPNHRG